MFLATSQLMKAVARSRGTHVLTRRLYASVVFAVVLTHVASAQTPAGQLPPSIRVVGDATATARPDQAEVDVGVTTYAASSREAAARNAEHLDSVLDALTTTLGADANIKTIAYTLSPEYRLPKEGQKPTISGYTATNIVRVTLNNLDKVGEVIDAATQAGANRIHRVRFTLKDRRALVSEVLREAAITARSEAEALASALGLRITRVLMVAEDEPVVRPFHDVMELSAAQPASTPVQPGPIEVRATVTLTLEVEPASQRQP